MSPSPELHESVCEDERQIVARHVVRLAGDDEEAGQGAGLEVQGEVEVTVGVLEGGEGEVGVAGERGSSSEEERLLTPVPRQAQRTEAPLLSGLEDPAHPGSARQAAVGVHPVDVVGEGGVRSCLGLQVRYFHFSQRVARPDHASGPPLGVCEGELDVLGLEQLRPVPLVRVGARRVVNVPGRQSQLGQLLLTEPLPPGLLGRLDVHLDLDGYSGLGLLLLRLGTVES